MPIDRREFLEVSFASFAMLSLPMWAQGRHPSVLDTPPTGLTHVGMLAPKGESGEPLIVTGTLLAADGKTPLAGALLYAYNTDATGLYSPRGVTTPRIRGWLRTDAQGRYELRTIKPGQYPGGGNPAHIHAQVKAQGLETQWIPDFIFDGDQFVDAATIRQELARGRFSRVLRPVKGSDGVLRAERDITLQNPCARPACYVVTGNE